MEGAKLNRNPLSMAAKGEGCAGFGKGQSSFFFTAAGVDYVLDLCGKQCS